MDILSTSKRHTKSPQHWKASGKWEFCPGRLRNFESEVSESSQISPQGAASFFTSIQKIFTPMSFTLRKTKFTACKNCEEPQKVRIGVYARPNVSLTSGQT
jgi:hypothetical protein